MNIISQLISLDFIIKHHISNFENPFLEKVFFVFTFLGNWQTILILGVIFTIFIFFKKNPKYNVFILFLWFIVIINFLSTYFLKILVNRPRPYVIENSNLINYPSDAFFSFPSWHAAISVAFYGFLTYFLLKNSFIRSRAYQNFTFILATILILGIGFSRIYLNQHFFSDVIGGYVIGGIILFCAIIKLCKKIK